MDSRVWFVDLGGPPETSRADDAETFAASSGKDGSPWLVATRELLGREMSDPNEFTYGPSSEFVHALMRARDLDVALPDDLTDLAINGGPPRRSGFAVCQLRIDDTVILGAGRKLNGLWSVAAVHEGTWVLAVSPHRHPHLRSM